MHCVQQVHSIMDQARGLGTRRLSDGSLQGAGGIGGLLAILQQPNGWSDFNRPTIGRIKDHEASFCPLFQSEPIHEKFPLQSYRDTVFIVSIWRRSKVPAPCES